MSARGAGPWLLLAAAMLCAIAVACGGAKSTMAPAATGAMPTAPAGEPGAMGGGRAELDALSARIDADLAAMGLSRPAPAADACIQPPCTAEALSVQPAPAHAQDPTCRPGGGDVCRDSCRLSDSICDNSGRICRIATDLGGGDAYANEKCAGGRASCETARAKCCGCL